MLKFYPMMCWYLEARNFGGDHNGLGGRDVMNGIGALIKRTPESSPHLLSLCEDSGARWPSLSQEAAPYQKLNLLASCV